MQYEDPIKKPARRRRGSLGLKRLGMKRMPWYILAIICGALLLMGWVLADAMDKDIMRLRTTITKAEDLVFDKERDVLRMSEQVRLAQTDQFIANEARTKYGYLFPGEIRFVVLNPEVLGLPPLTELPAIGSPDLLVPVEPPATGSSEAPIPAEPPVTGAP